MADTRIEPWSLADDFWRLTDKLNLRYIDLFLRTFGGHRLPRQTLSRLYTLGIPPEMVQSTLKSIRALDQWSPQWVETAQYYLGASRRETSAGNRVEAERFRYLAAMSYQAAQILEVRDMRTRNNCRAWAANLSRLSLPFRNQNARHFTIPWRDQHVPVLFEAPEQGDGPFGLVVLLNGVSLSKEETFNWAPRFLQAGYAVMAVDSPGTGEATALGPISPHHTDILDGILEQLQHEPSIDLTRVVLAGASLGGNEAIRIARRRPDVMAVITVTPAVEPARWMDHASPLLVAELADLVSPDGRASLADAFNVLDVAGELQQPMLIIGAGRDMVVPPNESQLLAAEVGERATYVWYPDLGHCLYAANDQWTGEAATWITAVAAAKVAGVDDPADLARAGQLALEATSYRATGAREDEWEGEEFGEYARLITPDERED